MKTNNTNFLGGIVAFFASLPIIFFASWFSAIGSCNNWMVADEVVNELKRRYVD